MGLKWHNSATFLHRDVFSFLHCVTNLSIIFILCLLLRKYDSHLCLDILSVACWNWANIMSRLKDSLELIECFSSVNYTFFCKSICECNENNGEMMI